MNTGRPALSPRSPRVASIQVVDRAVAILEALAASDRPLSALEIAAVCGLNRSTISRILSTLERHDVVSRDAASPSRYVLGGFVDRMVLHSPHASLVRRAHPILQSLASDAGEIVALAVVGLLGVTYVDHVDPPSSLRIPEWSRALPPGRFERSGPLHATATGKVFLAWIPPEERRSLVGRVLERYTPATVTDWARLDRELAAVLASGFAVASGEYEEYTAAVSAPVLVGGRPLAIVNLWGPKGRLPRARLRSLGEELRRAAGEISSTLSRSSTKDS